MTDDAKIETELKLALSPDVARKLRKGKIFRNLRVGRSVTRRLVSTYFDTPMHLLRKSGVALRVRDDGERCAQTVKAAAAGTPGLQNRAEWTTPVNGDRPVLEHLVGTGAAPQLAHRREADLLPVFTTDLERTTMRLKTRRAEVEFAIDEGVIRAGANGTHREELVCEAEFELLSGDASSMLKLALEVCESYDARPAHLSKAQRGYALARPALRPRPEKAEPIVLDKSMTTGESFQAIVRDMLEHLLCNQSPTLAGHPEGIHQTRVAMRRLRAALRAFKRLLPYHERKAFNGEFRWFQQRLSPARDWHVFLAETLPLIAASGSIPAAEFAKLRRIAQYERRRATTTALVHLESRRYARLILEFQRWAADLEQADEVKGLGRPAVTFARRELARTRKELLEEKRPLKQLPPEDLHTLRKRGKKARYATEFFRSLFEPVAAAHYIQALEELQDRLGETNDAGVAPPLMLTLRPGRLPAGVLDAVQGWSQARITDRLDAAQVPWRRIRRQRDPKLTPVG
jgi:inorganic triphosphatase YgiF